MKKILGVILVSAMVLAMNMQIFAAPSVTGGTGGFGVSSDKGTVTWEEIDESAYPSETVELVNHINDLGSGSAVKDAFEGYQDLTGIKVFDTNSKPAGDGSQYLDDLCFLTPMWQFTFVDIDPTEEDPAEVTFTVTNMTETMEVYVLYYCSEHGWELLETTRSGANQLTACFHAGSSLAALVYIDKNTGGNEGTSPKTGENNSTSVLTAAAVLLAALGILTLRKSRKTV